jgi:Leu/Phe-tRNA-protein transferase
MFHRVSHASKAAYGRALVHLKEREFVLVDSTPVKDPSRNYGEEWIPQWRFEELLREALAKSVSFTDDRPAPLLPPSVRRMLPLRRAVRKLTHKLAWRA